MLAQLLTPSALPYFWLVLSVVLLSAEMLTPGFVVGCIGIACFPAAVAATFPVSLATQGWVFVVSLVLVFALIRPFVLKTVYRNPAYVPTNVTAVIGRQAVITTAVGPHGAAGRAKVNGEDWRAITGNDGPPLPVGALAQVLRVEGSTVVVKPIDSPSDSATA